MTLHNVNGNFKIDGIEKSRSKGAKDKWPRKKKLNTKASLNSLWEKMSYQERQVALEQTGSNLGDADYNSLSAIGGSTADVLSDYIRNLPRNVAMEEEEVKDEEMKRR